MHQTSKCHQNLDTNVYALIHDTILHCCKYEKGKVGQADRILGLPIAISKAAAGLSEARIGQTKAKSATCAVM